jgi:phosphoglucomutase
LISQIAEESSMIISPLAGKSAPVDILVDVPRLVAAYFTNVPDVAVASQRVAFGTSGHRGSSLDTSFNECHVVAISQAICEYRASNSITGPLFIGIDTHALSIPACASALEVFAANGVDVMLAKNDEYTPTPSVSLAIMLFNRGRTSGFADGIVISPSHNPPSNGGYKYNPPNGGPADTSVTQGLEARANVLLSNNLAGVRRMPYQRALRAPTTQFYDFMNSYVGQLDRVINFDVIRESNLKIGVDPLGGAGVHYWHRIAEKYQLNLSVISELVDPTFRFMSVDWDGQIRMDPSSEYAMQRLIHLQHDYDIAFACDTDHDRHGIVTPSCGLLGSNHYLSVAIDYLFGHRPLWSEATGVGKSIVSTQMIDRVCAQQRRKLIEVPVGFKWFVDGLTDGSLGFAGEESAGATFLRLDGSTWTTDKDGLVAALLAAEITASKERDPGEEYQRLTRQLGTPLAQRIEATATLEQKKKLARLSVEQIKTTDLAGQAITAVLTKAPGNDAAIGGIKVTTKDGWFAARPSGTEDIYKIYAESFLGQEHLDQIIDQAQHLVDTAIAAT